MSEPREPLTPPATSPPRAAREPGLPSPAPPAPRLALFRLGGRLCGVAAAFCKQFVHLEAVTPVPLAPSHLLGVTQLRGRILPVLDAGTLLGLAAAGGLPAPRPDLPADQGETAAAPPGPVAAPGWSPGGESGMPALVVTATGLDSALAALRVTEIVGFEHPSPALATGGPPRWREEEVAVLDVTDLVARLRPAALRPVAPSWPSS
jgi:hypothetical protein